MTRGNALNGSSYRLLQSGAEPLGTAVVNIDGLLIHEQ